MKPVNRFGDKARLPRTMMPAFAMLAAMLVSATASAQGAGDHIRDRVKEGQKVSITDEDGREFTGRISSLTADTLIVERGALRAGVPYQQVVKIDRPRDTLANGALIGFGVGAAAGFLAMLAEDNRACDPAAWFDCSDPGAGGYAAVTLVGGGLGTAIGVAVDALIRRDRHIYRRGEATRVTVAPAVSTGTRAAVVAVSW